MADIYSLKTTNLMTNYGNTEYSKGVALYKMLSTKSEITTSGSPQAGFTTDFAHAIYGNGPYSLLTPNNTTDKVAGNIDLIA